jgi:hypothetical protein
MGNQIRNPKTTKKCVITRTAADIQDMPDIGCGPIGRLGDRFHGQWGIYGSGLAGRKIGRTLHIMIEPFFYFKLLLIFDPKVSAWR